MVRGSTNKFPINSNIYTSLLGCCTPLFYFNCDNVLFVYSVKQKQKNSRISSKNFMDFQNFQKFNENRILMEA